MIPEGMSLCDECCLPMPNEAIKQEDHNCLGQGHDIIYDFNELVIDKSHLPKMDKIDIIE